MNIKAFARGEGRQAPSALDQGCEERQGGIATTASGALPGPQPLYHTRKGDGNDRMAPEPAAAANHWINPYLKPYIATGVFIYVNQQISFFKCVIIETSLFGNFCSEQCR